MHLKLNNYLISGEYMNIPRFGLGTFRLKEQAVIDSVKNALDSVIVQLILLKSMKMKRQLVKRLLKVAYHVRTYF